jgi:hypothetical protein
MTDPFSRNNPFIHRPGWLIVILAAAVALPGCPRFAGPVQPKPWVAFESKEGKFKALFPIQPSHKTSGDGREHRYTADYRNGARVLRVAYELDYDSSITLADRFEAVANMEGVRGDVRTVEISLGGHPGMEAEYEIVDDESTIVMRHRIYHVGTTSYQVLAGMFKGEDAHQDVERFFQSFELLPE